MVVPEDEIAPEDKDVVMEGDEATYFFFGIDSDTVYKIYNLSFLLFVYFLPLCCLLVSYIFIIHLIRRRCHTHRLNKDGR